MKKLLLLSLVLMPLGSMAQSKLSAQACQRQQEIIANYSHQVQTQEFNVLADLLMNFDCQSVASLQLNHEACLTILKENYQQSCQ